MEEEVKKSNKKLVWYILFSFVTVILLYLFVVVYFFYISPYNISAKITLWPFLSEEKIGELYSEAAVKVQFKYEDLNTDPTDPAYPEVTITIDGINIDKSGYILFPFSEISKCTDYDDIKVLTASGTAYNGKFVYGNKDYNLALVKCESTNGKKIKIPYVKVYASPNYREETDVILVKSKIDSKTSWTGAISETNDTFLSKTKNDTNIDVFDYSVEGGFLVETLNSFNGGVVLDKSAHFYGFCYKDTLDIESLKENIPEKKNRRNYFVMPAYAVNYFFDDAVSAYKKGNVYENEFASRFVGFDKTEAGYMKSLATSASVYDKFYFNGDWQNESAAFVAYSTSSIDGYYLFNDFIYGDKLIAKNSVITAISVNGRRIEVERKVDLLSKILSARKGDEIVVYYQKFNGTEYTSENVQPIQIKL